MSALTPIANAKADIRKTYADNINAATVAGFGRIPGGASISSQSTNYQVLSSDQFKLIVATAAIIYHSNHFAISRLPF